MDDTQHHRRGASIVIVEDDASLLNALSFALEAEGLSVDAFRSAETLLSAPVEADCMVIDLQLPGLDGLALISRLRARKISSPAILITTNPTERTRRAAAAAGAPIVEKPLITGELRRRIDELVASKAR